MKKPSRVIPVLFAMIGVVLPFLCAFVMLFFEAEREEAIGSGLILGSALGAIMGATSLILNRKRKRTLVKILGVIDVVPICILAMLFAASSLYVYR